jgi:four helix bundle protein
MVLGSSTYLLVVVSVTIFVHSFMAISLRVQIKLEDPGMSSTYTDLEVWQGAMELAVKIYQLTIVFPKTEIYGLTSQLRRAAVSVPSNIAEGKGRSSDKELVQFLCHSRGSLFEIETQLSIAEKLGDITSEHCDEARREVVRC